MISGTLSYRWKLKMLKIHCLSDLGRVCLPDDESGNKFNHKYLSVYLKFMYKLRQLLNFSIAAACSYIILIWSLATVILKVLGKGKGKGLWAQIIDGLYDGKPTSLPHLCKCPNGAMFVRMISKKQWPCSISNPLGKIVLDNQDILIPITWALSCKPKLLFSGMSMFCDVQLLESC